MVVSLELKRDCSPVRASWRLLHGRASPPVQHELLEVPLVLTWITSAAAAWRDELITEATKIKTVNILLFVNEPHPLRIKSVDVTKN